MLGQLGHVRVVLERGVGRDIEDLLQGVSNAHYDVFVIGRPVPHRDHVIVRFDANHDTADLIADPELVTEHGQDHILEATRRNTFPQVDLPLSAFLIGLILPDRSDRILEQVEIAVDRHRGRPNNPAVIPPELFDRAERRHLHQVLLVVLREHVRCARRHPHRKRMLQAMLRRRLTTRCHTASTPVTVDGTRQSAPLPLPSSARPLYLDPAQGERACLTEGAVWVGAHFPLGAPRPLHTEEGCCFAAPSSQPMYLHRSLLFCAPMASRFNYITRDQAHWLAGALAMLKQERYIGNDSRTNSHTMYLRCVARRPVAVT